MTPKEAYEKCYKQKKRILKLEDIIATDSKYSYCYSFNIIKGPWERGEEAISKDPWHSYLYARDVIKGPFEKSHPIIFYYQIKDYYLDLLKRKKYDMNKISEWLI